MKEVVQKFEQTNATSLKSLKEHLGKQGVSVPDMVEAGLLISGDDIPVPYDRFRDRVMFPITDMRGRIIAFGGRALDKDAPAKYLNSPETPLFHKGHNLYNGAAARQAVHDGAPLIVVEGYVDKVVWPDKVAKYRDFFTDYEARVVADRPVNIRTLERYLLLANDLPGLKFTTKLEASKKNKGASTLIVEVTEKPVEVNRSEERRVGKECRSRWSPYH